MHAHISAPPKSDDHDDETLHFQPAAVPAVERKGRACPEDQRQRCSAGMERLMFGAAPVTDMDNYDMPFTSFISTSKLRSKSATLPTCCSHRFPQSV